MFYNNGFEGCEIIQEDQVELPQEVVYDLCFGQSREDLFLIDKLMEKSTLDSFEINFQNEMICFNKDYFKHFEPIHLNETALQYCTRIFGDEDLRTEEQSYNREKYSQLYSKSLEERMQHKYPPSENYFKNFEIPKVPFCNSDKCMWTRKSADPLQKEEPKRTRKSLC